MNESMLDRLVSMENRYEELGHMLMDPDIGTDIKKMTDVTKEQASLQAAYDLFQEYKEVKDGIDGAKELMKENDPEIKEMAKMELDELEERMPDIIKKLELEGIKYTFEDICEQTGLSKKIVKRELQMQDMVILSFEQDIQYIYY